MRKQPARRHLHVGTVRPLEDHQGRNGADIVGNQIGARDDRFHTSNGTCVVRVDRANPRVRMGRSQQHQPQRAIRGLVVDIFSASCQQTLVFETLDGLARAETHVAGQNIHVASFNEFNDGNITDCLVWRSRQTT